MGGLFITGTNTGVGKTYVGAMIAQALLKSGQRVGVYKPVESGCRREEDSLFAADANLLWHAAGQPGTLQNVCPQCFEAALAPPLAAAQEGKTVDHHLLRSGFEYWRERSEIVLVEGAGGLMSPLSDSDYNIGIAKDLGLPLVVVAANELGTINATLQTLITARSLAPELSIAGVVLNQTQVLSEDQSTTSNAKELRSHLEVPLLATVEHQQQTLVSGIDWLAIALHGSID
ncbi:MAG: dethiobiotin synthase [Pirellulales bacterium]|nr:dethiobiotin synthase [Pirellulales bacterium]